jgi:hypothetical protein
MAGLWEAPKDRNEAYIRGAAVALAAFILTGFVYLAIQRIAGFATGRAAPRMSRAVGSEYLRSDSDTPAAAPAVSPMSPGVPAYRPAAYSPPSAPLAAPTFAPPGAPGYTPFAVDAQRKVAQEALKPLHDILTTVRRYDSQAVWSTIPTVAASSSGGPTTVMGSNLLDRAEPVPHTEDGEDAAARDTLAALAEVQRRRQNTERILGETESISTELTLVAHPDRFPEPLRDGVGDVAREMRIYLATVQLAAAHPEDKDRLHTLATQHLANSESALVRLESIASGSGTGAQ